MSRQSSDGGSSAFVWERAEFTLPAVARRLPRLTLVSAGATCNRRVTARIREFGARGRVARLGQGRDERAPGGCDAQVRSRSTAGGGWV